MNVGKSSLGIRGKSNPVMTVKKENENLKRIIGELTFTNNVLKKPWREAEIKGCKTTKPAAESAQVPQICQACQSACGIMSQRLIIFH